MLQSTASAASRCTATPNLCFFFILPPMPLQPEPFPDDPSLAELSQVMSWLLLLLQRDGRRRFCCLLPPPRRPTTAANAEAETGNQHLFAFAVEATNLSQFKIRRFNCMFIRPLIMCACLSPCTSHGLKFAAAQCFLKVSVQNVYNRFLNSSLIPPSPIRLRV